MAISDASLRQRAQAPVEGAVIAHLAGFGRRVDRDDIERVTKEVMAGLPTPTLQQIASSGLAQGHLIQAALSSATAQISTGTPIRNFSAAPNGPYGGRGRGLANGILGGADRYNGGGRSGSDSGDSDDGPISSARYDQIGDVGDYSSPAGQARMRSYAHERGVGWAGNHPDILRLGPAAIETLAAVQFRREMFERSIGNGYRAHDVVGLVNYARETGRDPHALANNSNEAVEILGRNNPQAQDMWRGLYRNLGQARTPQEREAAERALIGAYTQHAGQHPEDRGVVQRHLEALGAREAAQSIAATTTTQADAAAAQANAATTHADAQETQVDSGIAALNGPPSASTPSAAPPADPPSATSPPGATPRPTTPTGTTVRAAARATAQPG